MVDRKGMFDIVLYRENFKGANPYLRSFLIQLFEVLLNKTIFRKAKHFEKR